MRQGREVACLHQWEPRKEGPVAAASPHCKQGISWREQGMGSTAAVYLLRAQTLMHTSVTHKHTIAVACESKIIGYVIIVVIIMCSYIADSR